MKKILNVFVLLVLMIEMSAQGKAEFRAVWVSTVKMLDYPSKKGLGSEELKREFDNIVALCKSLNLNAIIFQVRPAADAFYASKFEPWSEWLTGKQGRPPEPYFDPLEYMVETAHKNNIQFHAWINPFRAIATIEYADVLPNHISKTKPQWCFDYGKHRYLDPGIPQVQDYIVNVIADIVKRYNIDGVHFDDYFYPYPEKDENNRIIPLPDYKTYEKYGKSFARIEDWRRDNINRFVRRVNDTIKKIRRGLVFGVSPTPVWRNKEYDARGSATRGLASYDWLYADVLLWVQQKWVDYVAPQIYSHIGHKQVDYRVVLQWWAQNVGDVVLYIGLNLEGLDVSRKNEHWSCASQIAKQMKLALKYPQVKGFILYRYASLRQNKLNIRDTIQIAFKDIETKPLGLVDTQIAVVATKEPTPVSKPLYVPEKVTNLSGYFVEKELILMWDWEGQWDSLAYFVVYEQKYNKKSNKTELEQICSTENNFVSIEVKKKLVGRKRQIVVCALARNGIKSVISDVYGVRVRKFVSL